VVLADYPPIPISEEHPQKPNNPYGNSKLVVEQLLKDFDVSHGIRSIALRYFNAAGADLDVEISEDHTTETHLIPLVLDVASGKRPHITIFGDDYSTSDGTCIRDYIHVSDLADAHVLALKELEQGVVSSSYNLGNGHGYSVKEVITAAEKVTGRSITTVMGGRRPGDPDQLVGDARRAKTNLGWEPKFGSIGSILEHAWKWRVSS